MTTLKLRDSNGVEQDPTPIQLEYIRTRIGAARDLVSLTAAAIASPSPAQLSATDVTYALNTAPWTRYRSNGTALVPITDGATIGAVIPVAHAGASYTFALADAGDKVHRFTNGTAAAAVVPTNAVVPFPVGSVLTMRQAGVGALTVVYTGVTVNFPADLAAQARTQHSTLMLTKVGTDEWDLTGDLAAAS